MRIPLPPDGNGPAAYEPEIALAIDAFQSAVGRLNILDPILLEVVRIRCARTHDCRMCKASRYQPARDEGLDETMLSAVDAYEQSSLPERLKVALRYTDMFLSQPGKMSPTLRRDLHRQFTEREILALSLEIAMFSIQKPYIALGLDVLPGIDMEHEVAWFEYDATGRLRYFNPTE
jgi:alkylhydroperoxidase family enzyme